MSKNHTDRRIVRERQKRNEWVRKLWANLRNSGCTFLLVDYDPLKVQEINCFRYINSYGNYINQFLNNWHQCPFLLGLLITRVSREISLNHSFGNRIKTSFRAKLYNKHLGNLVKFVAVKFHVSALLKKFPQNYP